MKILSVNVGLPREVAWRGRTIRTGIYKEPIAGRVASRTTNLDGDRRADLTVHGGPSKAVYAYPAEHYEAWAREFPRGFFGENLTTEGIDESLACIGNRFRVGTAELTITEPRMPCYKLGIRFGDQSFLKRFLASRRSGIYFAVAWEGNFGAGDEIEPLARDPERVSDTSVVGLFAGDVADVELLRRAARLDALPENWKSAFRRRLEDLGG